MTLMAYFHDEQGNELEYSGTVWCWFGSYVDGRKGTVAQVEVRRGKQRYMITADTFPGKQVTVKMWAPKASEYRKLVPGPLQTIHSLEMTWPGRENNHPVA